MSDKKRILIVDDTPANIKVLNSLLRDTYNISVSTNGPDALAFAESENQPDLILLDIMMPEMDGYEVCRRLKSKTSTRQIPVLFVTAKGEEEDEAKGFSLGAVDYIVKPVNPVTAMARIDTQLKLAQARKAIEKQNEILRENFELKEDVERITRHDMKNPLMVIIAIPEIIAEGNNLTQDQKEMLDDVKSAGYRLLGMIDRSLDLYKMEKGVYKVKKTDVNILSIFHKIKTELSSLLNLRNISVLVQVDDLKTDPDQGFIIQNDELLLFSLFSNLMKNAIEASPEDGCIKVATNGNGEFIEIRINNKGVVPQDIRDSFFEKYVTSGKTRGTGLGTYSARLMAETMGGHIKMETSDDDGTTISVHLPL